MGAIEAAGGDEAVFALVAFEPPHAANTVQPQQTVARIAVRAS